MNRRAVLTTTALLSLLTAGCAPRQPPPLDAKRYPVAKDLPPLGTGSDVLRVEILPPGEPYRVGDKLEVRVRVTNISHKPVVIARKIDGVYFCGRRVPLYALRVTDRQCRQVQLLPVTFIDAYKNSITSKHRLRLAPGKSHTEKFVLYERRLAGDKLHHERGYDINRPGRYRLWFDFACVPNSDWSLGTAQIEWFRREEAERRRLEMSFSGKADREQLESLRPPKWLKELARCHVAARPVVLEVRPGTPREALEKYVPPPRPEPVGPEDFFGRRYVPARFTEDGNPVPKAVREKLERQFTLEFSAKDTLGKAVGHLRQFLPLGAEAAVVNARLGTDLRLVRRPAGDVLYWLARLTKTSLVLRGTELVFVKGPPALGAAAVREHHLPAKPLFAGDEHPAVRGLRRKVYVELKDLTVGEALRYLQDVSDVGITTAPGVAERKFETVKMVDVTVKAVLDRVVAAAGCDYEVRRGLVFVYPGAKPNER
jgi:hypothetical protein